MRAIIFGCFFLALTAAAVVTAVVSAVRGLKYYAFSERTRWYKQAAGMVAFDYFLD